MPGRMNEFMPERGVVAFGVAEGFDDRHLHVVQLLRVIGAVAAVLQSDGDMLEEFLGALDALDRCELPFGLGVVDFRKTVDLLDVEHCVALEERDFALDILTAVVVVPGRVMELA